MDAQTARVYDWHRAACKPTKYQSSLNIALTLYYTPAVSTGISLDLRDYSNVYKIVKKKSMYEHELTLTVWKWKGLRKASGVEKGKGR